MWFGPRRLAPGPGVWNELLPSPPRNLRLDAGRLRDAEHFGRWSYRAVRLSRQQVLDRGCEAGCCRDEGKSEVLLRRLLSPHRMFDRPQPVPGLSSSSGRSGAGLVLAFRRAKCNSSAISVALGGIEPEAEYKVEFIDEQRQKTTKTMSGRTLATDLSLIIPQRGASLLVRYRETRRQRK